MRTLNEHTRELSMLFLKKVTQRHKSGTKNTGVSALNLSVKKPVSETEVFQSMSQLLRTKQYGSLKMRKETTKITVATGQ
uniref:Uncharacterized protein n=1 Tax=Arion vulgaris TaxID=1028688 RepID=A0A0B7ADM2_9EUPU